VAARNTDLDKQWEQLMLLCDKESEYEKESRHPKVRALLGREIESLAAEMGFSPRQIEKRQFRAERDGRHIIRILAE
jgi:hypothetical protein